jgi:hypothetical protein
MTSQNLAAKRALKNTPRLHCRTTCNNTPGIVPVEELTQIDATVPPCQSTRVMPSIARQRLVTQHALNALTILECLSLMEVFTPRCLLDDKAIQLQNYIGSV